MSKMQAQYIGSLRCEARHLQSSNTLITDAPKDNHGKGEAFSPTDLLCSSLATCMITIIGITANAQEIPIEKVEAEIEKVMTSHPRRVSKIKINLKIRGDFNSAEKEKLELAALNCPVAKSLHPELEQEVKFIYE